MYQKDRFPRVVLRPVRREPDRLAQMLYILLGMGIAGLFTYGLYTALVVYPWAW